MSNITLKHLTEFFPGDRAAVNDLSLEIESGELFVFTGPAGSGKSAVLRLIAGLDTPTSGEIFMDGMPLGGTGTKERNAVLVTREFPVYKKSMSVFDNLAYGLKQRKVSESEIRLRVNDAAAAFGIESLLSKKVSAISETDCLRVALCRAAVRAPKTVLIDDIFAGMRETDKVRLMSDILALKENLGSSTVICAFGDGSDALTLGSRIAVLKDGKLRAVGDGQSLYNTPDDAFVASWFGVPQMNFLPGRLVKKDGEYFVDTGSRSIPVTKARARRLIGVGEGATEVLVGIRPEDIHAEQLFTSGSPETIIEPTVRLVERLGGDSILYMNIAGVTGYVTAMVDSRTSAAVGEKIALAIDGNKMQFFDKKSGRNLAAVPALNMLPCKLLAENDGSLSLYFGSNKLTLPSETASRLLDRSVVNGDVRLAVATDKLSLSPVSGGFEIKGEAEFSLAHGKGNAVYVTVGGQDERLVVTTSEPCEISAGEKLTLRLSPDDVMLCRESGARLLARYAVTDNAATAMVSVRNGKATATVGSTKFMLSDAAEGSALIRISPKSVTLDKRENTLSGLVQDYEFTGEYTLIRLKTDGFEPYFTAALAGAVKCEVGKKIKLYFDSRDVGRGAVQPLSEYIKERAEDAPPYVYVREEE